MMQQIASVKPESAASALPLDFSDISGGNSGSRESFNSVLQQQSNQATAFAQARENANSAAAKLADKNNAQDSANARLDKQNKAQAHDRSAASSANARARSNEKSVNSAQKQGNSERADNNKNNNLEQAEIDKQALRSIDAARNEAAKKAEESLNTKRELALDEATAENFDYINYVSQLAKYTGNDVEINANEVSNSNELVAIAEDNILLNIPNADKEAAAALDRKGENGDFDLLQAGINKEELQLILDTQNAQIDLSSEMSNEQMLKLQSIVADMLNQLEQTTMNKQTAEQNVSDQVKLSDQALLAHLLVNAKQTGDQSPSQTSQDILAKLTSIGESQLQDAAAKQAITLTEQTLKAKATQTSEDESQLVKGSDLDVKINNKRVWHTTPDLSNVKPLPDNTGKPEIVKLPIDNILALNDEQTELAANNIKERLQAFVSDLKTEAKGAEFVAALQNGVKEFKQQLAQGREPGLNLKDLVAEALASANVDTDKSNQPKIDTAINQSNAVLNLANAINYSANQQQAQVLGMSDQQFAKEINTQHIEGTKLANTVNNAANTDKAINILKPEGQAQLVEKVRWMVNSRNPSAEIRLDPPDLGGVNIKINLSGDTAQVNFTVQSNLAKDALDQGAPRLREMLQQQGIELGQSTVQQDSRGDQQQQGEFANSAQGNGGIQGDAEEAIESTQGITDGIVEQNIINGSVGGIDYYA